MAPPSRKTCFCPSRQFSPIVRRKPALLLILLAWLTGFALQAQTIRVRDAQSLDPLPFVTVYSLSPRHSLTTDASGQFDLSFFQGADTLRFRYLGYDEAVLATEQLAAQGYRVYLRHDPLTLAEVVVAANRWEQDRRELPFVLEQIAPREVALLQPQTTADFLGSSGRVFIQKSQLGGGSPMVRGLSANRLLLVVDGVRMNNAIFRSGNLQNVLSIDPHSIEEAEVIFGPASVMYGSDALGAVMDFHTQDPPLAGAGKTVAGGKGMLRFATANRERTAHGSVHLGGPAWGLLTSLSASAFGDLRMGNHGPDDFLRPDYAARRQGRDTVLANENPLRQVPTGYRQFNFMQKVRYQPRPDWDILYAFHYATTTDIPRYDRLIERREGRLRYGEWYYGPQQWLMTNLKVRHQTEHALFQRIKATVAFQDMEESRHDRRFGDDGLRHREERVRAFTVNLDVDAPLTEQLELFYGGELVFNRVGSQAEQESVPDGSTVPISTRYPDGSTWNSAALYANLKANPHPQWTIMGGLRYARVGLQAAFDTTFFDFPFRQTRLSRGALTGSLGVVWRPGERSQGHLNASSGFRAPNIDDIGKVFDSEPGAVVVPNPDLAPEFAYTLDAALIQRVGRQLRVEVSAFHTWLDNAMIRRDFQLNGQDTILYDGVPSRVQAIQNAAAARLWGVEGSLEWRFSPSLSLSSRLSWQDGLERAAGGEAWMPPRHVAPLFGATQVRLAREGWQVVFYCRYNGAVPFRRLALSERNKPHIYASDEAGRPFAPAWYTLNLSGGWQATTFLQVQASLENITDRRYRPYSSGIAGAGRNLVLALRARW